MNMIWITGQTRQLRMIRRITLFALLCLCLVFSAAAETLVLPDSLTEIADEAFSGDTSVSEVIIPDQVTRIGDSAFAGCSALERIIIPESVALLGEHCLKDCVEDLLIAQCRAARPARMRKTGT